MFRVPVTKFCRFAFIALMSGLCNLWAQPIYLGEHKLCDGITLKDRAPPEFRISHEPTSGILDISGDFEIGIAAAVEEALERHDPITAVRLNSQGGNIYQGRAIAQLIERHELNTHVANRCYSACTLAFIAGKRRYIGPHGQLGFHGYGFASLLTPPNADPLKEQQRDLDWLATRIHDATFLAKIFEADCSTLWVPTREELLSAGVAEPDDSR